MCFIESRMNGTDRQRGENENVRYVHFLPYIAKTMFYLLLVYILYHYIIVLILNNFLSKKNSLKKISKKTYFLSSFFFSRYIYIFCKRRFIVTLVVYKYKKLMDYIINKNKNTVVLFENVYLLTTINVYFYSVIN